MLTCLRSREALNAVERQAVAEAANILAKDGQLESRCQPGKHNSLGYRLRERWPNLAPGVFAEYQTHRACRSLKCKLVDTRNRLHVV